LAHIVFADAFEHFLILEIMKLNSYFELDYRMSYFRTKEGKEIDLILSRGRANLLIEIKSKTKVSAQDIDTLIYFKDELKPTDSYLLSNDPHSFILNGVHCLYWQEGLKQLMVKNKLNNTFLLNFNYYDYFISFDKFLALTY
jgi:predicted AAA+ superfamily ATPase